MSKPLTAAQIEAKLTELKCSMPGYMRITPKIARKLLERVHDKQRPVDNNHVKELVNAIRSNTLFGPLEIKFDYNLNLVDGQHTLHAIVALSPKEYIVRVDFC